MILFVSKYFYLEYLSFVVVFLMDIIGDLHAQTKHFILHITDAVYNSFTTNGNSSYAIPLLLPLFLFMACVGIKKKSINAIFFMVLLVPACVNGLHHRASGWDLSAGSKFAKDLLAMYLTALRNIQDNMPVVIIVTSMLCYLVHHFTKSTSFFFYLFTLAFYYNTVLYSNAVNAYFHMGAFFTIMITLPIVALIIFSKQVNRSVASFAFAFTGVWGVLQLAMYQSGLPGKRIFERILDDLLSINFVSMKPFTVYFIMAMASSIFVQYSLDWASAPSTSLESSKVKNEKVMQPH